MLIIKPLYIAHNAFQWTWNFYTTFDLKEKMQPTITILFYIWPLLCENQLHYEDMEIFQQYLRRSTVEVLKLRGNSDIFYIWMMGEDLNRIVVYTLNIYVRIWITKFGAHMPILEAVKFHGLDDECLLTSHNELQRDFKKMFTLEYCPHHYTVHGI